MVGLWHLLAEEIATDWITVLRKYLGATTFNDDLPRVQEIPLNNDLKLSFFRGTCPVPFSDIAQVLGEDD